MSSEKLVVPRFDAIPIAATSNASPSALPGSSLELDSAGRDLLSDPALVENFADIVKRGPLSYSKYSAQSDTDMENESASGSVIVSRKSPIPSPSKQRSSLISNTSSHYSVRNDRDPIAHNSREEAALNDEDYISKKQIVEEGEALDKHIDQQEPANNDEKVINELVVHAEEGRRDVQDKELTWVGPNDFNEHLHLNDDDNTESLDLSHEYDYSDSEFEDKMEKRLQYLTTSPSSSEQSDKRESRDHDDDDDAFEGFDLALSDDDEQKEQDDNHDDNRAVENEYTSDKVEKDEMEASDEEVEEDDEDYGYGPQYPPRELDPEKLYALHNFFGQDPSHCQLQQDEPCILLNDQDSYWWLIKRLADSKIGFAPAELLETFPERLARLNCWKNENMSSQSVNSDTNTNVKNNRELESNNSKSIPDTEDQIQEQIDKLDDRSPTLKDYKKGNKSVSFNDVVGYAERYIEGRSEENGETDTTHHDEFIQVNAALNDQRGDDELSEVVSDVSFNTASMVPLDIKKVRAPNVKEDRQSRKSDDSNIKSIEMKAKPAADSTEDDLRKIFEAPVVPFVKSSGRNVTDMANSNSDYSISTIGEFSPSSSEWTNDSPQLANEKFQSDPAVIPSSRAIQDFSKFVEVAADDEAHISHTLGTEQRCSNKSCRRNSAEESASKIPLNFKHNSISMTSSSSSSEEFLMESERVASSASINSTSSVTRQVSTLKHGTGANPFCRHPFVDRLYSPVLLKMDDLLKELNEIVNE